MKWIIVPILIILMLTMCSAWEINYLEIKNETISIIPTINICENTTSVFKIRRENYSVNSSPLELNYIQKIKTNTTKIINITKTINKYTNSKTGNYTINKNGKASLIFEIQNKSLEWNFSINCFDKNTTENIINKTINNTIINKTINESVNLTINTSINLTNNISMNKSLNLTNNISINKSENIENDSIKNETTNKITCPKEFEIKTNKKIFFPGEKLEMQFLSDQWIENYEITYHIELLNGTIAKKQYTTKNNKTKTYTIKSSKEKEQAYKIIAKMESECKTLENEELFVVKNQIKEEAKEKTNISLKAKVENEELELTIEAKRGDSSKSVINIFFENEKGKKIRDEVKMYLESKGSKTKLILKENISDEKIININVEGLGIYRELTIENKEYNKTNKTTKEEVKKVKEEKTKTTINKTKQTKTINELKKIPANIELRKPIKIEAAKQKNIKKSTNILFTIALASIIGIGSTIYFRKHSAQNSS